jgi:hypothetical protein
LCGAGLRAASHYLGLAISTSEEKRRQLPPATLKSAM